MLSSSRQEAVTWACGSRGPRLMSARALTSLPDHNHKAKGSNVYIPCCAQHPAVTLHDSSMHWTHSTASATAAFGAAYPLLASPLGLGGRHMAGVVSKCDKPRVVCALGVQHTITRNLAPGSYFSHLHHPALPENLSHS